MITQASAYAVLDTA